MKKILPYLILVLIATTLFGCGQPADDPNHPAPKTPARQADEKADADMQKSSTPK